MLKNYLFSPLCSARFLCSSPLFLFLSALHTSVFSFLFPGQPPLFFFSFLPAFFFFSLGVLPFIFQPKRFSVFQPKTFLLQPKTFFSSAQNVFFFSVQPLFSSSSFLQTCCSFKFSLLFFQRLLFFFSLAPFIKAQYSLQLLHISLFE